MSVSQKISKLKSLPPSFGKFTFPSLNGLLKSVNNTVLIYQIVDYPKMIICLKETSAEKILVVFDIKCKFYEGVFFNSG